MSACAPLPRFFPLSFPPAILAGSKGDELQPGPALCSCGLFKREALGSHLGGALPG